LLEIHRLAVFILTGLKQAIHGVSKTFAVTGGEGTANIEARITRSGCEFPKWFKDRIQLLGGCSIESKHGQGANGVEVFLVLLSWRELPGQQRCDSLCRCQITARHRIIEWCAFTSGGKHGWIALESSSEGYACSLQVAVKAAGGPC